MTMAGRHGGRDTEHAGVRDFTPESPLNRVLRHIGRHGARENDRFLVQDQNCETEWIGVRYGVWQGLEIGKTYTLNGRKGKILDKRENAGKNGQRSNTGLPRVLVQWK